jgi:hypothetical protein
MDLVGAGIAIAGALVIMGFGPRSPQRPAAGGSSLKPLG